MQFSLIPKLQIIVLLHMFQMKKWTTSSSIPLSLSLSLSLSLFLSFYFQAYV